MPKTLVSLYSTRMVEPDTNRVPSTFPGFYLGFFAWGEVDPEKKFGATRRREKIF